MDARGLVWLLLCTSSQDRQEFPLIQPVQNEEKMMPVYLNGSLVIGRYIHPDIFRMHIFMTICQSLLLMFPLITDGATNTFKHNDLPILLITTTYFELGRCGLSHG